MHEKIQYSYTKKERLMRVEKFVNDLYYGRITPWERKKAKTAAELELNSQIVGERAYITKRMSEEERSRFEELERLCMMQQEQEKIECFRQGLCIGARFMTIVHQEDETLSETF